MTERELKILDFGWELMKSYYPDEPVIPPTIYLWLEEDGWVGGSTVRAEAAGPGAVSVKLDTWERLSLLNTFSQAN